MTDVDDAVDVIEVVPVLVGTHGRRRHNLAVEADHDLVGEAAVVQGVQVDQSDTC